MAVTYMKEVSTFIINGIWFKKDGIIAISINCRFSSVNNDENDLFLRTNLKMFQNIGD